MALHIINKPAPLPSFGESLATGLVGGLQQLAKSKVNQLQRQGTVNKYINAGYDPHTADLLVQLGEQDPKGINDRLGMIGSGRSSGQSSPSYDSSGGGAGQQQQMQDQSTFGSDNAASPSFAERLSSGQSSKEVANRFKETKEITDRILADKRASRSELQDLDRIEELSSSGKLDTPGYVEFLNRSGFDIPALMNPESEEFQKIQQGFLKGAKQYFGGRISNYEVEQFLKTIPSLSQSPEGRQRVIAGLKKIARGKSEYFDAYQEVIKKHKGVPPYDLDYQIEQVAEKRLDKISDQFRKDLNKPVPKGQNKLITALQAGLGSSVKPLAKTALGATAGGLIGGPVGAGIGAGGAALASKFGLI